MSFTKEQLLYFSLGRKKESIVRTLHIRICRPLMVRKTTWNEKWAVKYR